MAVIEQVFPNIEELKARGVPYEEQDSNSISNYKGRGGEQWWVLTLEKTREDNTSDIVVLWKLPSSQTWRHSVEIK